MADTVVDVAVPSSRGTGALSEKRMPHVLALDGVRGVAIILVLLFHLLWSNNLPTGSALIDLIVKLKNVGWVGVDLFFTLSGFLITGIIFDSSGEEHYFRNFYVRRVLRIFPLYYGVLLILFLVFRPSWKQDLQLYVLLGYLQNTPLWLYRVHSTVITDLTGHLWSLAVEEQFYLLWPIVVFWVRDRRKLIWITVAFFLVTPVIRYLALTHGATYGGVYKGTIFRADSLLAGAWLALMVRGSLKERVLHVAPAVLCSTLLACVFIEWKTKSFIWERNNTVSIFGYTLLALAGISLIAMALRTGSWTASIMKLSPLRWMGKYSYGIYVFHMMTGVVYSKFVYAHVHSKVLLHVALLICNLIVTLPLAWLSFHFYEKPFLRLKRSFGPT